MKKKTGSKSAWLRFVKKYGGMKKAKAPYRAYLKSKTVAKPAKKAKKPARKLVKRTKQKTTAFQRARAKATKLRVLKKWPTPPPRWIGTQTDWNRLPPRSRKMYWEQSDSMFWD